ncbi:MAG: threonine/serine exporter ThrE family protein [Demequina sp.]|uniref:threonine/serine ThrE exporter family protein n=1 Tax=Demequina sp. TaxID=2050685 RepID=UPI003A870945
MSDEQERPDDTQVRSVNEIEESLEPVTLIEQSRVILRVGRMMLAAGTASYRVKQAMAAVSHSLGVHEHSNHVSMTAISATSHRGKIFRTEVTENRSFAVNVDRLAHLDRMRRTLPERTSPQEVHRALDEIEGRGALYPGWVNSAVAGVACGAFAVLNGGVPWEVLIVVLAAMAGQQVRRTLAHRHFNTFGVTLVAAAVATALYAAGIALVGAVTSGPDLTIHAAGYISSVLFLLPGFALITGALDMAKNDVQSGIQRIVYATMLVMAAGVSVWAVSLVTSLETAPRVVEHASLGVDLLLWAVPSFLGVLGFALMFNSPWRLALTAAGIGGVANTARLWSVDAGLEIQAATTLACLLVGCLAALAARGGRFPVITLSVPAVLVMIPGVPAHEALVALNSGDYISAAAGMLEVSVIMVSIMVGLVAAKLVTDREWATGS